MKNNIPTVLPLMLAFALINWVNAQALPEFNNVPGGIVLVNINEQTRPAAYFNNNRVMVIGEAGNWQALIGIPLSSKPGTHRLIVKNGTSEAIHHFDINDKEYETQHITITDQRKVNPAPVDMERINKESKFISQAKATWSDANTIYLNLELPVDGPYSSSFGLRRFFNGQPRKPHSGMDIAVPLGTPIKAAAPGQVINTGDYFFNGKTVFVDHGQGMITMYCHMDTIRVEQDQAVQQGQIIGTVGRTGRVTGAHLHWSVIMNNTMVDPKLFIEK